VNKSESGVFGELVTGREDYQEMGISFFDPDLYLVLGPCPSFYTLYKALSDEESRGLEKRRGTVGCI